EHRVLAYLPVWQIGGGDTHHPFQGRGVADQDDAGVVGHVEVLVGVGAPGVGQLHAGGEVGQLRSGGGPETESPVDVHPGTHLPRCGDDLRHRVECAGVDVPRLDTDDGRA